MENYKELLSALYKEHAPEKLDQIDFYLDKYKGKEKQFYIAQKAKYANKKSVKDSKKILEEAMARIHKDKQKPLEDKPKKTEIKKKKTSIKSEKEAPKKEGSNRVIAPIPVVTVSTDKEPVKEKIHPPIIKEKAENIEPKEEAAKTVAPPKIKQEEKMITDGIVRDPYKRHNDSNIATEKEEEKKRAPFMWILYLIIFFILVAFIVYLFSYPISFFESRTADVQKSEQVNKVKPKETNVEAQAVLHEDKKKEDSDVSKAPIKDRLYASDIDGTVIFVACFAEKKEELAQKKVDQLKEFGLKGHYYWIPDMDPSGNAFFKIVVGPFNTHKEAYPSLTKVQERINFDAYILVVKK